MTARQVAGKVARGALWWVVEWCLVLIQLAGCFIAAIGATRLYLTLKGEVLAATIGTDQVLFYVGAILVVAATAGRWKLRS